MTPSAPTGASRRERWVVWHPLLFAAYPVLFLWSQNLGEASAGDVLPLVVRTVALAALAVALLTLAFRDARRAGLIVSAAVVALLMYGHVANLVGKGHYRVLAQQAGWIALVVIAIVGAIWLSEPWLRRLSRILDRVAVVLLIVVLILIVPEQASSAAAAYRPPTGPGTATAAQRPLRDVYYLILDRYGSDRSLELRFGVRNDLTPWLTANGFRVLPDSHANYVKTTLSMASTLNMTHLADLAAQVGTDSPDYGPIFGMLKDSRVARQFKALGYQYLHIGSYYSPTQIDPAADRNLYPSGPSDFEAVLYATTAIPVILRKLHLNTAKPVLERFYASGLFDWRALDSVRDAPGPKFVFGHFIIPHPPFVFGRDGQFVDPAADPSLKEADRLTAQLGWTNDQLKRWITSMLALPEDQRPIIIIQADEGPYTVAFGRNTATYDWSKATPDELEMKYGILNAWYLPDGTDPGLYDSMTSVNTFPVLFSGYFGLDIPKLEDREFTSANKNRPYDLTDITERLAAASR